MCENKNAGKRSKVWYLPHAVDTP